MNDSDKQYFEAVFKKFGLFKTFNFLCIYFKPLKEQSTFKFAFIFDAVKLQIQN